MTRKSRNRVWANSRVENWRYVWGITAYVQLDMNLWATPGAFRRLDSHSRRVRRLYVCGSREIWSVSSLHRASTDALMMMMMMTRKSRNRVWANSRVENWRYIWGITAYVQLDMNPWATAGAFRRLARRSRRVRMLFVCGSREIWSVSSLHRASTGALIRKVSFEVVPEEISRFVGSFFL